MANRSTKKSSKARTAAAADVRPLVRLSVSVIAEQKGRREVGSGGGGGRFGLAYFDDGQIAQYVDDAVNAALTNLDARPALMQQTYRRKWRETGGRVGHDGNVVGQQQVNQGVQPRWLHASQTKSMADGDLAGQA